MPGLQEEDGVHVVYGSKRLGALGGRYSQPGLGEFQDLFPAVCFKPALLWGVSVV